MTKGVKIKYGDVTPGAKENFAPSVTDKADFVDITQLQKYNLQFENFANPCEYASVILDSSVKPFPRYPDTENMGLWSESISKSDGTFETAIVLQLETDGLYSSKGFTFTFDDYNNIFCNSLKIEWYKDTTIVSTKTFTPNSAIYYCENKVDEFNKVYITFYKMNLPYNRLKLRSLDYGYGTFFFGDELRNVNVLQELDPISSKISINTVDFLLDSSKGFEYSFEQKQPLEIYFDDKLKAMTFVSNSTRQTKTTWKVQSEDYIGQLAKMTFYGDVYRGDDVIPADTVESVLTSLFTKANIPFEIQSDLKNIELRGHIPICDGREALRQVCFAIGAVCDTSQSDKVVIKTLSNTITQNIDLSRIRQGQKFTNDDKITGITLTSYTYLPVTEEEVVAYNAEDSGTGEGIIVKFSEPLFPLTISNGEIIESSANYAIINANEECILRGRKFQKNEHLHDKTVPGLLSTDLENVVEVSGATLVNLNNCYDVLDRIYNYLIKTQTTRMKIYEGKTPIKYGTVKYGTVKYGELTEQKEVNNGDIITAETSYLGNVTGRVISQRYNLNGGIIVKDCEVV